MNWDISTPEGLKNAVEWQTALISTILEGGSWIVPRSMSIYRLRHVTKTAEKLSGFPEPAIQKVFETMGWTVVDSEGTANPPFKGGGNGLMVFADFYEGRDYMSRTNPPYLSGRRP